MSQRGDIDPRAFRTKRNLTLARLSEVARPLLSVASSALSFGGRTEPREWRNGLIISHTHMGDVLYRTCSLEHLAAALPNCRWSYLASPLSAQVLANNPHIDEVLPVVSGENSWDLADGGFGELKRRKFDVVLCTNTLRHYPDFLLAAALGIPNRVGFIEKGMSGLITRAASLDYPQSYPAYFRSFVAQLTRRSPFWDLRPRVYPDVQHFEEAERVRASHELGPRPVLACTLSTRQESGAVSFDLFVSILRAARELQDFDIAFCGAREEREQLSAIAKTLPFDTKILAGELSVLGFAAFLSTCFALRAPDSGPRHLGNAVGIPVFFTRNLAQLAVETGKYCSTETDLIPSGYELVDPSEIHAVEMSVDVGRSAWQIVDSIRLARPQLK